MTGTDSMIYPEDPHSFARPNEVVIKHLDLDINVDFDKKILSGIAKYNIENKTNSDLIYFDTRGLKIDKVYDENGKELNFKLEEEKPYLGSALAINITPETKSVTIKYSTNPDAPALQWLEPQQTAGGKHPFLFTQSQAILARTWIPIQDGPAIRFTYNAKVKVPKELMAVMSAENPQKKTTDGIYTFTMDKPIPSYLMALAVGDIVFEPIDDRTGIYAEPETIDKAVHEFEEMVEMVTAAEKLYGPYRWGRYDLLVLPPSFPFGGMENPELTFATPTILAGDRSLTSLVAHELAHSWSGNLVTNSTWNDFWLNEGFTVYFERRIMESLYGESYADMLSVLGYQDLVKEVEELGSESEATRLKLDLKGKDPDDGMNDVAYEKGYFLLLLLEKETGRQNFDNFLKKYFSIHAFKSMTTEQFIEYLDKELLQGKPQLMATVIDWIYKPGIPANIPKIRSERFENVDKALTDWEKGNSPSLLNTNDWSSHEWLHFIRHLPATISIQKMEELDAAFNFTNSGNSEILAAWLEHVIENKYTKGYDSLRRFLTSVGRRKFLLPLYKKLVKTGEGKQLAMDIYKSARPNYHSVSVNTIDDIVGWKN